MGNCAYLHAIKGQMTPGKLIQIKPLVQGGNWEMDPMFCVIMGDKFQEVKGYYACTSIKEKIIKTGWFFNRKEEKQKDILYQKDIICNFKEGAKRYIEWLNNLEKYYQKEIEDILAESWGSNITSINQFKKQALTQLKKLMDATSFLVDFSELVDMTSCRTNCMKVQDIIIHDVKEKYRYLSQTIFDKKKSDFKYKIKDLSYMSDFNAISEDWRTIKYDPEKPCGLKENALINYINYISEER